MFTEHSEMQERILKRNLGKRSRFGVHLYREQGRHLLAPLCVLMRAGTFCLGEQLPQWRYFIKVWSESRSLWYPQPIPIRIFGLYLR